MIASGHRPGQGVVERRHVNPQPRPRKDHLAGEPSALTPTASPWPSGPPGIVEDPATVAGSLVALVDELRDTLVNQ
jgi:hypothetical protein